MGQQNATPPKHRYDLTSKNARKGVSFIEYDNGSLYEGTLLDHPKKKIRHGKGIFITKQYGALYGDWKNDVFCGNGCHMTPYSHYWGLYHNGLKAGIGLLIKDNVAHVGIFHQDILDGTYISIYSNGLILQEAYEDNILLSSMYLFSSHSLTIDPNDPMAEILNEYAINNASNCISFGSWDRNVILAFIRACFSQGETLIFYLEKKIPPSFLTGLSLVKGEWDDPVFIKSYLLGVCNTLEFDIFMRVVRLICKNRLQVVYEEMCMEFLLSTVFSSCFSGSEPSSAKPSPLKFEQSEVISSRGSSGSTAANASCVRCPKVLEPTGNPMTRIRGRECSEEEDNFIGEAGREREDRRAEDERDMNKGINEESEEKRTETEEEKCRDSGSYPKGEKGSIKKKLKHVKMLIPSNIGKKLLHQEVSYKNCEEGGMDWSKGNCVLSCSLSPYLSRHPPSFAPFSSPVKSYPLPSPPLPLSPDALHLPLSSDDLCIPLPNHDGCIYSVSHNNCASSLGCGTINSDTAYRPCLPSTSGDFSFPISVSHPSCPIASNPLLLHPTGSFSTQVVHSTPSLSYSPPLHHSLSSPFDSSIGSSLSPNGTSLRISDHRRVLSLKKSNSPSDQPCVFEVQRFSLKLPATQNDRPRLITNNSPSEIHQSEKYQNATSGTREGTTKNTWITAYNKDVKRIHSCSAPSPFFPSTSNYTNATSFLGKDPLLSRSLDINFKKDHLKMEIACGAITHYIYHLPKVRFEEEREEDAKNEEGSEDKKEIYKGDESCLSNWRRIFDKSPMSVECQWPLNTPINERRSGSSSVRKCRLSKINKDVLIDVLGENKKDDASREEQFVRKEEEVEERRMEEEKIGKRERPRRGPSMTLNFEDYYPKREENHLSFSPRTKKEALMKNALHSASFDGEREDAISPSFVDEIDAANVQCTEVVGKGGFGTVLRGILKCDPSNSSCSRWSTISQEGEREGERVRKDRKDSSGLDDRSCVVSRSISMGSEECGEKEEELNTSLPPLIPNFVKISGRKLSCSFCKLETKTKDLIFALVSFCDVNGYTRHRRESRIKKRTVLRVSSSDRSEEAGRNNDIRFSDNREMREEDEERKEGNGRWSEEKRKMGKLRRELPLKTREKWKKEKASRVSSAIELLDWKSHFAYKKQRKMIPAAVKCSCNVSMLSPCLPRPPSHDYHRSTNRKFSFSMRRQECSGRAKQEENEPKDRTERGEPRDVRERKEKGINEEKSRKTWKDKRQLKKSYFSHPTNSTLNIPLLAKADPIFRYSASLKKRNQPKTLLYSNSMITTQGQGVKEKDRREEGERRGKEKESTDIPLYTLTCTNLVQQKYYLHYVLLCKCCMAKYQAYFDAKFNFTEESAGDLEEKGNFSFASLPWTPSFYILNSLTLQYSKSGRSGRRGRGEERERKETRGMRNGKRDESHSRVSPCVRVSHSPSYSQFSPSLSLLSPQSPHLSPHPAPFHTLSLQDHQNIERKYEPGNFGKSIQLLLNTYKEEELTDEKKEEEKRAAEEKRAEEKRAEEKKGNAKSEDSSLPYEEIAIKIYSGNVFVKSLLEMAKEYFATTKLSHPNIINLKGMIVDCHFTTGKKLDFLLNALLTCPLEAISKYQNFYEDYSNYFHQKSTLLQSCHHLVDQLNENSTIGLIFDLVPKSKSLHRVLMDNAMLVSEILFVSMEVCKGLMYLHSMGIIHCDIKSDNILITSDFQTVKLCDLGLACRLSYMPGLVPDNISLGCIGTHGWTSPEVLRGERMSFASDVYSFGITLWEMVTRKTPFEELSHEALIVSVGGGLRKLRSINEFASVPLELMEIQESCCRHNPGERPSIEYVFNKIKNLYEKTNTREYMSEFYS